MSKLLAVRKISIMKNQDRVPTYRVVLPPEWIRKNRLENGGDVVLVEEDDGIMVKKP